MSRRPLPLSRRRPPSSMGQYQLQSRFYEVMAHAQTQALKRYGVDLREAEYLELCDQLQRGVAEDLGPARSGGRLWRIALGSVALIAVYREGLIRTFLDPSSVSETDDAGAQES